MPATRDAVKAFQSDLKTTPTGELSKELLASLKKAIWGESGPTDSALGEAAASEAQQRAAWEAQQRAAWEAQQRAAWEIRRTFTRDSG